MMIILAPNNQKRVQAMAISLKAGAVNGYKRNQRPLIYTVNVSQKALQT